jgi:hypothetical protein
VNYLKTSRVVVIDDLPNEALPVIEAVGRLGIGCIYLTGERLEDLPKKPLRGIRLVVLDMRLGTSGGAKQTASMTANVFCRTISPDEGPLILLLWTKHDEDIPAFKNALFDIEPKFRNTLLIADLEKPLTITEATFRKVLKRIGTLARAWEPMDFLWSWEQLAHDAATETTAIIANHVSNNVPVVEADSDEMKKQRWLTALKRLFRALAEASGGRNTNEASARDDLLEALIAINDDRLEIASMLTKTSELGSIFDHPAGLNDTQAAQLNGMVLIGAALPRPQELRPGNVYILSKTHGPFKRCGIDTTKLTTEILATLTADQEFRKQDELARKHKEDAAKAAGHIKARDKRRNVLFSECKPIVAEITPPCDFAQRNRYVVRLAGGLLVPASLSRMVPGNKESLRSFELVVLPGIEGLWKPVFSGRFLFTMKDPNTCSRTRPAFRLRTSALSDLRSWYASQSARPGYLSIPSRA